MPNTAEGRYTVGSVAKAVKLIDRVAEGPSDGLTLSELARLCESSKSSTYGLVRTLTDAGYLRTVDPGPRYTLGISLIRLGDIVSRQIPMGQVTAPVLRELNQQTGLTVRVAESDDGYPVFVKRVDAVGAVRFHAPLGVREPPHASAAGKAILAWSPGDEVHRIAAENGLPRRTRKTICDLTTLEADLALTRRRGFAVDDEEDNDGVFCVAAPFFDHSERCAGAVSVTGIKRDLPTWQVDELGRTVRSSANQITRLLGGNPPSQTATNDPSLPAEGEIPTDVEPPR